MKRIIFNGGGYAEYSSPSVAAIEVAVEKGFAQSVTGGLFDDDLLPGLEDGGDF